MTDLPNSSRGSVASQRNRSSSVPRWPALVLIPALIVAAALFGRSDEQTVEDAAATELQPQAFGPVVPGPDSLGSFWFCAGGTGEPGSVADHQVTAINTQDEPRVATVTVYGSRPDGGERPAPVTQQTTIPAYGRTQWRLGDVLAAPYVSATVELDGGGVTVQHSIAGPFGVDAGPCSSTASGTWSVPVGGTDITAAGAVRRELLVFFNPFPADAVLDVRFSTDTGDRGTPEKFRGFVVPSRGVVGVDLAAADVVQSTQVAAEVVARTGQVVVDRVQIYADPTIAGVALSTGIPTTAPGWVFPNGSVSATRREVLVIANPSDIPAEVDVEIRPQDEELATEPFELTVQPHRHYWLDLATEERMQALLAEGRPYTIIVRTADGTSVAAERLAYVAPGQPGAGVATSPGLALAGNTLVADFAGAQLGSLLTVFNPSNQSVAQIELSILRDGVVGAPIRGRELAIQPGRSATLSLEDLAEGTFSVVLRSTLPVMAEADVVLASDRYLAMAVPDAGSARLADLSLFGE